MNKVVGFLWTLVLVILFVGDQIPFLLVFVFILLGATMILYHYRPEWFYMDKELSRKIKNDRLEREAEKKEVLKNKENKETDTHLDNYQ